MEIEVLKNKDKYSIEDLLAIMSLLRSEKGCAWDREQTHKSIRSNLIEEAYEVIEAIDNDDAALMKEELGDLLLQVVFHSRISEEEGRFSFGDVCDELCRKLVTRHPHVFADTVAGSSGEVLKNWEAIKIKSKEITSAAQDMARIPPHLPALMRAQKIGKKSAKAGFDYDDTYEALNKVREETAELEQALRDNSNISEEIGDLLLAVSEVARHAGVDAEEALNSAGGKFINRFSGLEKVISGMGLCMTDVNKTLKNDLWESLKTEKQ